MNGEKKPMYDYLSEWARRERLAVYVTEVKNDPLYDAIRDEPEFILITTELENNYAIQHERVRQWLEENDML
jgi:hypothetical protein